MQSVTPWTPGEYSALLHEDCHRDKPHSSEIFTERSVFIVAVISSKNGASGCVLYTDGDTLIDGKECEQKWKKCERSSKKHKERRKRKRKHGDEVENESEDREGKDPCDEDLRERRPRKKKEKRKKNCWHALNVYTKIDPIPTSRMMVR